MSRLQLKTVNRIYNYSTVLEAAIKCKPYSEITVESRTQFKTVKITSNIFAVRSGSCCLRSDHFSKQIQVIAFMSTIDKIIPVSIALK